MVLPFLVRLKNHKFQPHYFFPSLGFNVNHLDIAPRYAPILLGFSNGIGTLAGLTCPFVTEKLTANGSGGWVTVFLLASLIHFTGVTFYAVYASGELQVRIRHSVTHHA